MHDTSPLCIAQPGASASPYSALTSADKPPANPLPGWPSSLRPAPRNVLCTLPATLCITIREQVFDTNARSTPAANASKLCYPCLIALSGRPGQRAQFGSSGHSTHNSRLLVRQDGVSILSKSKCRWESASLRSYASFSAGHGRVSLREQPPSAGGGSEGVVVGKAEELRLF
jgi:hypothetical protein